MSKRSPEQIERLTREMRTFGVTYRLVAEHGGWSWNHVWRVIHGTRISVPVLRAARELIAVSRAAKREAGR